MCLSVCIYSLMFIVSICNLFDGNDKLGEDTYTNLNQDVHTSPKHLREDVWTVSHIRAVFFRNRSGAIASALEDTTYIVFR